MTAFPEIEDQWLEVYGKTKSKIAACRAVGVSSQFYLSRQKENPVFRERMVEAVTSLCERVQSKAIDELLYGAEYETLDREGNVITLRKPCSSKLQISFLERFCGWGEGATPEGMLGKDVRLVSDGKPVPLLALLRAGIEQARGITIEAPRDVKQEAV